MRATITAVGIAGRDPELKFAKNGKPWTRFSMAVTERVKENDEWVDGNTTWFDVYSWGSTAESVAEYVTKGKRVLVTGSLKRNDWETQDGEARTTLEISADSVGIAPFPPKHSSGPRKVKQRDIEAPF